MNWRHKLKIMFCHGLSDGWSDTSSCDSFSVTTFQLLWTRSLYSESCSDFSSFHFYLCGSKSCKTPLHLEDDFCTSLLNCLFFLLTAVKNLRTFWLSVWNLFISLMCTSFCLQVLHTGPCTGPSSTFQHPEDCVILVLGWIRPVLCWSPIWTAKFWLSASCGLSRQKSVY